MCLETTFFGDNAVISGRLLISSVQSRDKPYSKRHSYHGSLWTQAKLHAISITISANY